MSGFGLAVVAPPWIVTRGLLPGNRLGGLGIVSPEIVSPPTFLACCLADSEVG